jgi:hypothetical protein
MCTELLPPGGYPIAVNNISYHISYHMANNALFEMASLYVVIFSYETQQDFMYNKQATDI